MSTSVAMAPNDQQSRRGILELAGHPTRYTQTKVKGVRKKKKAKPVQKEKDINDSTKKPYHPPKKVDGVPVASKRRSRMAIGQLKIINAQDRVQQLIKLAEDGRRKSNTLPPLEREASFARQPRKTSNSNNKNGQSGKDVEEKPVRKVSVKMDRKIVSHLRHHLNKRLQKRFDQQDEPLEYPSDEEEREGRKSRGRDLQGSGQGEKGIFANYSETGEKIQETDGRKRRGKMAKSPSRPAMNHRGSTSSVSLSTSGMSGAEDGRNDENMLNASFKKSSPLPGIPSGQVQSADVDANTATEGTESTNHVDDQEDAFLPSPEDCTEVEDIDFWLTDVSPVQTPMASRPSSCASNGPLSRWERALEILSGTVHKPSPPNRAVINLYVASGYSDTEAERVFMQEHLYPGLRTLCMHQGHELRVHDLHWGFKDAISDDHRLPEIMHNVIKEIQKSLFGLNFLIILGQKLGPCLLPTWIQQGELEAIASLASKSADQQRAELKARIAQVEATRKEREAKTKLEGGAQTSTENTLSASRLADDQLDSARTDVTREGQEEIQVTAAEQRRAINLASKKELQELKTLREAEENVPDVDLLFQWYKLDENVVPAMYRLQPISSVYKDILKADATKRTAAKVSFGAVAEKIQKLLRAFAPKVLQDERDWRKYFTSVLEQELQWILDHAAGTTHHTAALVRTLDRWQHGLQDAAASQYMDVVQEKTPVLDHEAWDKVGALRKMTTDVVPEKMSASFLLDWAPEGINTSGQREHFVYAERMCKIINDQVSKQLAEAASEKDTSRGTGGTLGVWRMKLVQEVAEHIRVCHEKSRDFHGRKDVLMIMKSYLKSDYRRPLVLHGKPGSGKSAVLSKAAKEIHTWFNGCSPCIVVRMIGCTTESTNIRTLIRSICVQLCHIFGDNPSQVPTDSKGIFNDFSCRLGQAREQKPLILLLDGTDRLSDEHEGRKLMWLPTELPPFVHIIISTVSDDKYDCLPCAHKLLNGHDKSFLEVPKLDEEDALKMLDHWLDQANRALTNEQHNILMQAFRKCPFPLFLKTVLTDALCWTSYTNRESLRLGESVRQVCTLRFGRLERDHGEAMVRRALGYITAARNGVTVNELEDVLSLDEAVMDEVVATHRPPRRRLPILLWIRLRMDIEGLITEIQTDGTRTLTWAHQPIRDAAEERYLLQRDKAPSYHKAFAEYFLGTWAGRPKPFTGSERGTNRLVASQELYYDPPAAQGSKPLGSHLIPSSHTAPSSQDHNGTSNNHRSTAQNPEHSSKNTPANTNRGSFSVSSTGTDEVPERIYNLRRVNELPFHLTRSQQTSLLKRNCLCNYEWMLAKLCGTSLRSLLEEYSAILTVEPHEPELRLISDVLHLSGQALRKEPRQLASQLVGRLHRIVSSDVPRASGDPQKYPNLHQLLASAKQSSLPALIPSIECLTEPGGILFDLLSGHSAPITAVALTSDGQRALTTSRDGTLKLWDVRSGKVVKSIDGVGKNTITVKAAKNNTLAVTVELPCIRLWSLKTGVCVHTIDDYPDPASICVAAEGQLLVAVFDGSNMLRSWTTDTGFQLLSEAQIANNSAHKEASLLIADASFGDSVLHAFRSGNTASVQNAKSGKLLKTLKCQDPSSSITALAISREYFVVCCRQQYMSLHELIALELFDAKKGTYVRSVRGCIHDRVSAQAFTTNLIGTHAIAISSNAKNNTSDVTLWNLETEDHKHLAQHPSISTMGACLDFRFCMTGSPSENSLRVWDISGKVNQPGVKLKKQLGVADIWPMVDNPRYVVAKAVNNGPISVWNVAKGKCLQSAVRIERGLTEGSDAIVMRNTTLVILTDRGFSSVSDDSRPVFQTVLVYDLRLKKYVRRLPGCYIVPAPSHEYVLLDNDSLLGPSDNRSHFIIWNLVTGHAASRIKTNFKELERRRMEQGGASGIPPGGVHLTDVPSRGKRATSAMMTPWDRRAETDSARRHRHEKESEKERQRQEELRREKDNVVEAFIVSADQTTIVASFYAHHLCVFNIASQVHTQTLQTENSMLFLHTAALSKDGSHLVLANYDESSKTSYVTLWDCVTGDVKRRLRNEANVAAVAITDDASRVLIGHSPDELHIWDPMRPNSLRRIRCKSEGRDRGGNNGVLNFEGISGNGSEAGNSFCRMFIVGGGERAIVFAGDVSVWDLDKGTMLAAFSPDTRVTACNVVLDGALTVFGMYDKPELVILRLSGAGAKFQTLDSGSSDDGGVELFGETTGDTSDEEDNSEEEGNEEAGSAE